MVVPIWGRGFAAGTEWVEARDASTYSKLYRKASSQKKDYLVQNMDCAVVEKLCYRVIGKWPGLKKKRKHNVVISSYILYRSTDIKHDYKK